MAVSWSSTGGALVGAAGAAIVVVASGLVALAAGVDALGMDPASAGSIVATGGEAATHTVIAVWAVTQLRTLGDRYLDLARDQLAVQREATEALRSAIEALRDLVRDGLRHEHSGLTLRAEPTSEVEVERPARVRPSARRTGG